MELLVLFFESNTIKLAIIQVFIRVLFVTLQKDMIK